MSNIFLRYTKKATGLQSAVPKRYVIGIDEVKKDQEEYVVIYCDNSIDAEKGNAYTWTIEATDAFSHILGQLQV